MTDLARVLIADDDATFRDTTAGLILAAGYACVCANDVPTTVQMLVEQPCDLLIADVNMQGNEQLQLAAEARRIAPGMPIILVTESLSIQVAVHAIQLTVSAYLIKPVGRDKLLPLIEQCAARGRLLRIITAASSRMKNWSKELAQLAALLDEPARIPLSGPAGVLLAGTFEILAKTLVDLGRTLATLHSTENVVQPSKPSVILSKLRMIRQTLEEAIDVLEQSKFVFKSKRLGELRKQFQNLLENLEA